MSKLVVWYGLPGSGKSFHTQNAAYKGYMKFDDFMANAHGDIPMFTSCRHLDCIERALKQSVPCVLADVRVICPKFRKGMKEQLEKFCPELPIEWHSFTYDAVAIERCKSNVKHDETEHGRNGQGRESVLGEFEALYLNAKNYEPGTRFASIHSAAVPTESIDFPYCMNITEVDERVRLALNDLLKNDRSLFENEAHERSITHRLAVYVERYFEGWDVDCEYNRIGDYPIEVKRLQFPPRSSKTGGSNGPSNVYPDIVIHHRGENAPDDNLLIIEVKTSWAEVGDQVDVAKLRAFTGQIDSEQCVRYKFGLFLKFDKEGTAKMEWFPE